MNRYNQTNQSDQPTQPDGLDRTRQPTNQSKCPYQQQSKLPAQSTNETIYQSTNWLSIILRPVITWRPIGTIHRWTVFQCCMFVPVSSFEKNNTCNAYFKLLDLI
jgi:hypothetical protein